MSARGAMQPPADLARAVRIALDEDVGSGDVTADLIPEDSTSEARIVTRERAVLCGAPWVEAVYAQLDARVRLAWQARDGDALERDQTLCRLTGPTRALLTGERVALNFLQTLSGTATTTRAYVQALGAVSTRLLDTRKTLPGLRSAQKYAVRCGGGYNHRQGLFDAILIKENHIAAAGSIGEAVAAAHARHPGLPVEIECESLEDLEAALAAGVETVMLDNFSVQGLREAVARTAGRARLEASGGLTVEALAGIAATGVDFVSCGALTKDLRAVDMSMLVDT